ncbi:SMP-30/gluconolactonase/LRE family protein [Paractinoplanes brasiliensis]|nr:superoxide dismutase [Actinoplanes brasiliensis]
MSAALPGAPAASAESAPATGAVFHHRLYPSVLPLPNGFSPEGIAVHGTTAFTGSIYNGAIRRVDLRTGRSKQFVTPPGAGRISVGMDVDRFGRLWVAGGGAGGPLPGVVSTFRVYDTRSGRLLADVPFPAAGFLNDVKVTRDAVWFTDSASPAALVRVPVAADGRIGSPRKVTLTGDWVPGSTINANGIEATPDGRHLIVDQTTAPGGGAALYLVPATSHGTAAARRIDLEGTLASADGLVLLGRTLYVVTHDGVVKVELSKSGTAGRIVGITEVPGAAFASTADVFRSRLYVVDANLGDNLANIGNPAASFKIVGIRLP